MPHPFGLPEDFKPERKMKSQHTREFVHKELEARFAKMSKYCEIAWNRIFKATDIAKAGVQSPLIPSDIEALQNNLCGAKDNFHDVAEELDTFLNVFRMMQTID